MALGAPLSENLGLIGYLLVAFFILSWIGSYLLYKAKGYERLERSPRAGFCLLESLALNCLKSRPGRPQIGRFGGVAQLVRAAES